MAVLPCNEEEIDWNVDMEVQLFHAMRGHKPVGVNRYFQMACIHEKFSNSINKEISSKQIWAHLDTMYDMAALHESEILPFPNEQSDFDLPEMDFGEIISRKLDDLPLSQSLTPKGNETVPTKVNNSSSSSSSTVTTPVSKPPKNVTPVKVNQSHSTPSTNKLGKDLIGTELSVPLTPLSSKLGKNEIVKSESRSSRDNNSTPKSKPDGSPVVKVNKSASLNPSKGVKTESPSNSSQKTPKQESAGESVNRKSSKQETPNSKKHRSESSDGASQKKVKSDGEKKPKPEVGDVPGGKKVPKVASVNGTKKQKLDADVAKKSLDSAGPKHSKAEAKSNQPSTAKGLKLEEDSSSSTAASSKSTKVQGKGESSDNPSKRKRQKLDEKKTAALGGMPVVKRRRT